MKEADIISGSINIVKKNRRCERRNHSGFSLIDVILSTGIMVLLFGGVYLVYFSILDVLNSSDLRSAAASVLERHAEIIRNLPYDDVGMVGGAPGGIIPQTQISMYDNITFVVTTVIRNIDDPFDGTLLGSPLDTAPADYKIVEFEATCPSCARFVPLALTTTVAPKNLETVGYGGSLLVRALDANGLPISGASVHIRNTAVTPVIDIFDNTNASGSLKLIDIPTSTERYEIIVSRAGYSSEQTYPPAQSQSDPDPVKPHLTVAQGVETNAIFQIDRVSTIRVRTHDAQCVPSANKKFSLAGDKLIFTDPDVLKFATSSITGSDGLRTLHNIEWDTYSFALEEALYDLVGTVPLSPLVVDPNTTVDFWFTIRPAEPSSFLVTLWSDITGDPVTNAEVMLSRPAQGYSETLKTGRATLFLTDWSGAQYASQDGGIETESSPGEMRLVLNAEGQYATSTTSFLISNTFDIGSSTGRYYAIQWSPENQPTGTGVGSLRFQLASNNDNATWNFVGPDGTSGSYYSASGAVVWGGHANNRYLRYKAYLKTDDAFVSPEVQDIAIEFSGVCVPTSQVLFSDLVSGNYTLTITAPGYSEYTAPISISGDWQQYEVLLVP